MTNQSINVFSVDANITTDTPEFVKAKNGYIEVIMAKPGLTSPFMTGGLKGVFSNQCAS